MKKILLLSAFSCILHFMASGQLSIQAGSTITENFAIGTATTAPLPANWKTDKLTGIRQVGNYASASGQTELRAGNNMSSSSGNGIYNFGAGEATTATDRAIGGLSAGTASKSVNLYLHLKNTGTASISDFSIGYSVEKYREGTNAAGFSIQMYHSSDGLTWVSAGPDFLTSFPGGDPTNSGYPSAPGATVNINGKILPVTLAAGGELYLAWNYSVTSGTTTTNAQALAVDNVTVTASGGSSNVYSWNVAGTGSFNTPGNWTPARVNPSPSDVLQITTGGTCIITDVPEQTISKLKVMNNTTAELQAAGTAILTISGGAGTDLEVQSGSALYLGGSHELILSLPPGANAQISGTAGFTSSAVVAHRLTGYDAGSINFSAGSMFTTGVNSSGNPFGNSAAGSVVFTSGSTFVHQSGGDPFAIPLPASVTVFQPGSLYKVTGNASVSFSGRNYSGFELDASGLNLTATGNYPVSIDNLTITSGTLNFNMTGSPGHSIKGNIQVGQNGALYFSPAISGTVKLSGTAPQTISGAGTIASGLFSTLEINNASGIVLSRDLALNGHLNLLLGLVHLGASDLILGPASTIGGTPSSGAMVVATGTGKMIKEFAGPSSFCFPVGDQTGTPEYSPVTIDFGSGTFAAGNEVAVNLVNEKYPGDPNTNNYLKRYWNIAVNGVTGYEYNAVFQYVMEDLVGNENWLMCVHASVVPPVTYHAANIALRQLSAGGVGSQGTFTGSQAIPNVYMVSGSGSYCQGDAGLPVVLGGSQTDASYQLKKYGINAGSPVSGTGAALTWSGQTEGSYTVEATNMQGSVMMLGTAVITEEDYLVPAVSISTTAASLCAGDAATFTALPVNGGANAQYQWTVNGLNVGTGSATYTCIPSDNDQVQCHLTSSLACVTVNPVSSNVLSMEVTPVAVAGVTIAASANNICQGTMVSFTATPENGGANPSFQWLVNGSPAGSNNIIFSYSPANNDQVSCIMTSGLQCVMCNPTSSEVITMSVIAPLPVSVAVNASANNVCQGTPVTFTALPVNGGTNPAYQWLINGIQAGSGSPQLTYTPANGDTVRCLLTSSEGCTTGNPALSSPVVMTILPGLPVSVLIAESANHVCSGTQVTFTAATSNGGTNPQFQWKVNGIVTGPNDPVMTYAPQDNDHVTCTLTSNLLCASGNPATSNAVSMSVHDFLPVSVAISATATNVCAGTPVTFTAVAVNAGVQPVYQWKVNGNSAGNNSPVFTYVPSQGDGVTCTVNSGNPCSTGNPATSALVTVTVNPVMAASITIAVSENPVIAGTPVTFTAYPVNGGVSPVLQWYVNGIPAGSGNAFFTYVPEDGDLVTCSLTSSGQCVTGSPVMSDGIVMMVNCIVPGTTDVSGIVGEGMTTCRHATEIITVAGNGQDFVVESGGNATLIAGEQINIHPLTHVMNGGSMSGRITASGPYCCNQPGISLTGAGEDVMHKSETSFFSVYPNPTNGPVRLEWKESKAMSFSTIEIVDTRGTRIAKSLLERRKHYDINLSAFAPGLYIIKVNDGSTEESVRIIKL